MDARWWRFVPLMAALVSLGAGYRTPNFVVQAPAPEVARQIGDQAERFRHDLALEWLGKAMPNWSQPCPITVQLGDHLGAGGATSFMFDHGEVFGWQMNIQGPLDRVLDSVLPHEVTHTIFASHFRRPLPRWADEGACTTVEHTSERNKQQKLLIHFLQNGRGIPFSQMFAMREYPRDILPLYAQGHSLASFLLGHGGKRKYIRYLGEGMDTDDWLGVTERYYGFHDLAQLQETWLDWVRRGSPRLPDISAETLVAQENTGGGGVTFRGQSADPPRPGVDADVIVAGPLVPVQSLPAANSAIGWRAAPGVGARPTVDSSAGRGSQVLLEWSKPPAQTIPPVDGRPGPSASAPPLPMPAGGSVYDVRVPGATLLR